MFIAMHFGRWTVPSLLGCQDLAQCQWCVCRMTMRLCCQCRMTVKGWWDLCCQCRMTVTCLNRMMIKWCVCRMMVKCCQCNEMFSVQNDDEMLSVQWNVFCAERWWNGVSAMKCFLCRTMMKCCQCNEMFSVQNDDEMCVQNSELVGALSPVNHKGLYQG